MSARALKTGFGAMVRRHRERMGLTQADLAEKTGRSLEMIGKIERGQASASFETLDALSRALGVAPVAFFQVDDKVPLATGDPTYGRVMAKLAGLTPSDLAWISRVLDAALSRRS